MREFIQFIKHISDTYIWHDVVLFGVLAVGVLFTLWSIFGQYRALTHGVQVVRGKYDNPDDPGAINHFQALSAALSATVGLGNIGGVALAIALGGPGAVFWMWVVGLVGMVIKMTEVTLSMLYRNTDDPDNPHGGPMWVASKGFKKWGVGWLGTLIGGVFCITLLISSITGGNMFQAWNVSDVTHTYFGIHPIITGIVLAIIVGLVIIGGIKRIGAVAGRLVPLMCALYFVSAIVVLIINYSAIPEMFALIFKSAFSPLEAQGAFFGGTFAYAFVWGLRRALFSNEAGQGSAPIAHSAAKTNEPVREAVVSGLEPFIDTIIVCTLTALVILTSGMWSRDPEIMLDKMPEVVAVESAEANGVKPTWTLARTPLPDDVTDQVDETEIDQVDVYTAVSGDRNKNTGNRLHQVGGTIHHNQANDTYEIVWSEIQSDTRPTFEFDVDSVVPGGVFINYKGATLTAKSFDSAIDGLGKWLVTLAAWLFAISTMISWNYYGEQGMVYLLGEKSVLPYKFVYCALIVVACIPALIRTDAELDALTGLGTGVMLWANIPIILLFGYQAMRAYHQYIGKLKRGEFHPHKAPTMTDVVEGRDVER